MSYFWSKPKTNAIQMLTVITTSDICELLVVKTLVIATEYVSHTIAKVGTVLQTVTVVARVSVVWKTNVFIHKVVLDVIQVLTAPRWSTAASERREMCVGEIASEKDAIQMMSVQALENIATLPIHVRNYQKRQH